MFLPFVLQGQNITAAGNLTVGGYMTDVDSIAFENDASIDNSDADTLELTETVVKVSGDLLVDGQTLTTNHSGALAYVSTPGIMTINTGATNEYIEVYGTSDTNADNFTINNLTLTVVTH